VVEHIEIELVAVGEPKTRDTDIGPSTFDHVADGYRAAVDRARDIHAADGYRPGGVRPETAGNRRGGACDIVRPMLVDPLIASAIAVSPTFRSRGHLHLTFAEGADSDERALTWKVIVRSPRLGAVPATLHLSASPSQVVSVLELVPQRRLRWRANRFVEVGIAAIDSLADELQTASSLRAPNGGNVAARQWADRAEPPERNSESFDTIT
jgi:hypothetical protein